MNNLKILYLEDSQYDAEQVARVLKKAGIEFSMKLVDKQHEYEKALAEDQPDVILADHSLFEFNSLEALRIFKSLNLELPFILVTGTVSEEFAVNILKEGADDYLLKNNLARLPNAINSALEKFRIDRERREFMKNLIASEALLKEAEHIAGIGSWQVDMSTRVVKWSDETYRIYGYQPQEIVPSYEKFLSHVCPEDIEIVKAALAHAVEKLDSYECEFKIVDKFGEVKSIASKVVVQRDMDSNPVRLVGFIHDITARKQAEGELLETTKEVARLEKELVEQQLSHQKIITELTIQAQEKERQELGRELHDNINQILATVKMFLGMAIEKEHLRTQLLGKSLENVSNAIEEIRKLSRTLVAPSLGDIGFVEALEELIDEINSTKRVAVHFNCDKYIDKRLDAKKALMLYRIVQEQMNNILKYSRAGQVTITLKTVSDSVFLSIADNGVGFDPAKKGKGIGLRNISGRVEFFSGKMNLISAPGNGCKLEVTIPN